MSIEELKNDLKRSTAELVKLGDSVTPGQIVAHLRDTLWPFIDAHVEETSEISEVVDGLAENAEDILQYDTAKVIGACVAMGLGLMAELKKRLQPEATANDADKQVWAAIQTFEYGAIQVNNILEEVTIVPDDEEDDGEEGDGDGDDDDEGGDDDEDEGSDDR